VDAVIIGTPDHWHCQMVLDAAKAGKDIYCEKGFSRTLAEAKLMRDALKKSSVVFQLGHHARQATCAMQAREVIAQGLLADHGGAHGPVQVAPAGAPETGVGMVITINGSGPIRPRCTSK